MKGRTEPTAIAGALLFALDQRFHWGMPPEFWIGVVALVAYFHNQRTKRLEGATRAAHDAATNPGITA